MKREILASTAQKRGISLDPRTKLALLVSIAVFVLGGSYAGPMQWVMIALSAVPLLLFLAERFFTCSSSASVSGWRWWHSLGSKDWRIFSL